MIRRPPRSTLFPTRRSSDLGSRQGHRSQKGHLGIDFFADQLRTAELRRKPTARPDSHQRTQEGERRGPRQGALIRDRKSTRLNSSHLGISYAVFCLKKKNTT